MHNQNHIDAEFFHTHLWFPASDHDFRRFGSDFRSFCKVITEKKHCGRNRIDHRPLCGTEFTLVSLYSTEITRYHLWYLEYKLTRVNSIPHGRPWWILYLLAQGYQYHQTSDISCSFVGITRQYNRWSLRCSWSIACRCCSNYIFILDLTPGFNGSGNDKCKERGETLKFWIRSVLY